MDLTDEELTSVYDVLHGEYYYGQELVYQATEYSKDVRRAMEKIDAEIKRRARDK